MKHSFLLPMAISAFAVLSGGAASSQTVTKCNALEASVIQAMSKADMDQLYCSNKRIAESAKKMQSNSEDLADQMFRSFNIALHRQIRHEAQDFDEKRTQYLKEAGKYADDAAACYAENGRIVGAIKRGDGGAQAPKCD